MKTILLFILVIAFTSYADTLFAAGNLRINILPISAEKGFVTISTLGSSNLNIVVTDDTGSVIYSKNDIESTKDYRTQFDFHALDNGRYRITAVSEDITTERSFRMTDEGIKVGKEKTYMKPYFGYKDGILKYTFLNFQQEDLKIQLLNKNKLLLTKDLGSDFTVSEGINLSKLRNGTYEIILSAGNKEYSYTIDKR